MESKVLIAIPTRGRIHNKTVSWLLKQSHPVLICQSVFGVVEARIKLVSQFLKGDYAHIFFLDDDIVPPQDAIERLLRSPGDIVSCDYNIVSDGTVISSKKVRGFGLGACLIKREVLYILSTPVNNLFKLEYDSDGNVITGEDIRFCETAERAGFRLIYDKDIRCEHYKEVKL